VSGDIRSLARAATFVENHPHESENLLRELFPHTGKAWVVGITGPPGAGKSTAIARLTRNLRDRGLRVGILAVDPTSPYSGGAILGDRIRMQEHHADAGVFIRSMATRGHLGGLARTTTDLLVLLDAAGLDVILVETVGVGQDEIEVAKLAQVTVLVLVPGMGDDVQAIKAGIMEIADVYLLNKADQPGIDKLEGGIQSLLSLSHRADGWTPPIIRCVASEGQGIEQTLEALQSFRQAGETEPRNVEIWTSRLREMLKERLYEKLSLTDIEAQAVEVAARRKDPYTVVNQWMDQFA
jgi:LAO/AO transport system kinase